LTQKKNILFINFKPRRKERAIAKVSDIRSESAYLTIAQWNSREHVVVPMQELPEGVIVDQRFLCLCDIGASSADKVNYPNLKDRH